MKVFLSSTYIDLVKHRKAAHDEYQCDSHFENIKRKQKGKL